MEEKKLAQSSTVLGARGQLGPGSIAQFGGLMRIAQPLVKVSILALLSEYMVQSALSSLVNQEQIKHWFSYVPCLDFASCCFCHRAKLHTDRRSCSPGIFSWPSARLAVPCHWLALVPIVPMPYHNTQYYTDRRTGSLCNMTSSSLMEEPRKG